MELQYSVKVRVHLTLGIPAIVAGLCSLTVVEVGTPAATEVAQRQVEACLHTHVGGNESEVELDESEHLRSHHHATFHVSGDACHTIAARLIGLAS